MEKSNVKRLVGFGIGAVVFYFVAPYIVEQLPEEQNAIWFLFLTMVVNQIFIGVVGWQANHFTKYGVYIPLAMMAIYLVSTIVVYGQANFSMEFSYLQTGYIAFFLSKLITKRRKQLEKQEQKPFPKSVTRKK